MTEGVREEFGRGARMYVWANVGNTDTPLAIEDPGAECSIQVEGEFGGASIALHGSNDGTNFHPLADFNNTEIAITSAGLKAVQEYTRWLLPVRTGGNGTTDLTISVACKNVE